MRDLARDCFRLLSHFSVSHSMRVPVEVDEGGLYNYRYDLIENQPDEGRRLKMRLSRCAPVQSGYDYAARFWSSTPRVWIAAR